MSTSTPKSTSGPSRSDLPSDPFGSSSGSFPVGSRSSRSSGLSGGGGGGGGGGEVSSGGACILPVFVTASNQTSSIELDLIGNDYTGPDGWNLDYSAGRWRLYNVGLGIEYLGGTDPCEPTGTYKGGVTVAAS